MVSQMVRKPVVLLWEPGFIYIYPENNTFSDIVERCYVCYGRPSRDFTVLVHNRGNIKSRSFLFSFLIVQNCLKKKSEVYKSARVAFRHCTRKEIPRV